MIEYNLNGPEGNAFAVMGFVKKTMKDLSESQEDIKLVMNEMMSGDYEHLIATAEKAVGDYVEFVKDNYDVSMNHGDDDYDY
jgi:hypothetical protein|tara:strand:- start:529 stop:774 length:246 start_codon:yes stop_codon:yes gene_type:complete